MRIAFDQQIFAFQVYGGVSRYFYNLANILSSNSNLDIAVVAPLYVNAYLKFSSGNYVKGIHIPTIPKFGRIIEEINSLLAAPAISQFQPDIVHETYYRHNAYAPKKSKRILTVYDMTHEIYPAEFHSGDKTGAAKKASVSRADFIICISENTRQDLLGFLDVPEEKTATVHLGFDLIDKKLPKTVCEVDMTYAQGCQYILFVGNRRSYKNFRNFLIAYSTSPWLRNNFKIICFGGGRIETEEKRLIQDLGIPEGQIIQISGDDGQLAKAYQGAAAFVYPSLYEGFGIPPLEAMSLDCPVICSNQSSIPEIVGDAGEYFDPNEPDNIASKIENVLGSEERRNHLISLGRKRYKEFSWHRCAHETLKIYQKII